MEGHTSGRPCYPFLVCYFFRIGFYWPFSIVRGSPGLVGVFFIFFFFFRVHVLGYLFVFVFVFVFVCLSDSRYVIFFSFALESRRVCVRFFFFFLQLFATTNSFFFVTPILIRL